MLGVGVGECSRVINGESATPPAAIAARDNNPRLLTRCGVFWASWFTSNLFLANDAQLLGLESNSPTWMIAEREVPIALALRTWSDTEVETRHATYPVSSPSFLRFASMPRIGDSGTNHWQVAGPDDKVNGERNWCWKDCGCCLRPCRGRVSEFRGDGMILAADRNNASRSL